MRHCDCNTLTLAAIVSSSALHQRLNALDFVTNLTHPVLHLTLKPLGGPRDMLS
jgi:hypothetical protein